MNYVVRIWKNGDRRTSLGANIGVPTSQFPNTFVVPLTFQDYAMPGDTYEVHLYVSHPKAEIDKHPLHTFWSGQ